METLTRSDTTNLPGIWGKRSGIFSSHGFEYYDIAVSGGDLRSKHPLPTEGEATLDQVLRNNRSFLQIFGRNGSESDQVATLSFGLSGGTETIDALAENITRGLGEFDIRFYGESPLKNQINIFIESDDLDPMFLLCRMIDAPKDVYANIGGLKAQAAAQELRRQTLLESSRGKGKFYENIFYQLVDGNVSALEEVDGTAEFAWGYSVRGDELWNQGQSMSSLALDSRVDSGMRASLLDIQKYMAETPKGKRRFVFKIDAHPTTWECCPRATNFQLGEANFHKTNDIVNSSKQIRFNQFQIFGYAIGVAPFVKSENVCSECNREKESDHSCKTSEDKTK